MIRFADHTMEQQLKTLWKEAFADPDKFIDFYFKQKYSPQKTLVDIVDDKVLSTLQMLDYNFSFFGHDTGTSYISGAATQKNQRGNGLMRRLLEKSFEIMYDNQKLFSTLIPGEKWLFDFYEKFGYAKCFYLDKQVLNVSDIRIKNQFIIEEYKNVGFELASDYYINYFKNYDFTVKKTANDLKTVLDDHILAGGNIFFAFKDDKLIGMCFAIKNNDNKNLIIKEMLFENDDVKSALIKHSAIFFNCEEICLFRKASEDKVVSDLTEIGMIRIINVYDVLKIFAKNNPQSDMCLNVFDDVLNKNTGVYIIKGGICIKTNKDDIDKIDRINIKQLTEYIFGFCEFQQRKCLYINLMLN